MAKYKIALIGLFCELGLLSCYKLNSNISDEYQLEPHNKQEGIPEGRVKRESNPDTDYDEDNTEENPEFEEMFPELSELSDLSFELDIPSPPPKLLLNVNVYLDKDWTASFGSIGSQTVAERILKHTSEFLAHDSLDTKIKLVYDTNKFYTSSRNLVPSHKAFYGLLPQELVGPDYDCEGHPTAHIYLSAGSGPIVGKSIIDGMCSGSEKQKPRVIVRVTTNEVRTAMTLAHEIGHLIGMEHDFILGKINRKCLNGTKSGDFFMSYGSNRTIFSECSNDDFKNYYERVVAEKKKFWLKNGAVG